MGLAYSKHQLDRAYHYNQTITVIFVNFDKLIIG